MNECHTKKNLTKSYLYQNTLLEWLYVIHPCVTLRKVAQTVGSFKIKVKKKNDGSFKTANLGL